MAVEWLRNSPKRHSAIAAEKIHPGGVFEAIVQNSVSQLRDNQEIEATSYRLYFRFPDGNSLDTFDPYAFPPLLTDYDLYLSGEGTHYQKYEKLGAHVRELPAFAAFTLACGR
jgi:1,4-alpha-glucan branching enzyme